MYTPVNTNFTVKKKGFKGVKTKQACFRDEAHLHVTDKCHSFLRKVLFLFSKYSWGGRSRVEGGARRIWEQKAI